MKKVFLLLTLIVATISAWGATTVTKTASQLQSMHSWVKNGCYYQPFALDDVITVSSTDGQAKYESSPQEMRYYQWCDDGFGTMIFKAKPGYVITKIKLKYSQTTARTVPCIFWYNGNTYVPVCDTLPNNVARDFYSNQVVIYTGNTSSTSGQLRVQEYAVTYEQATLGRMYTKSTMDLGMQHGLVHNTHPKDITINDIFSLHSDPNTLKYYCSTTDRCFACYQANGKFWFNAHNGAKIKNIRVYYFTQSNQGVLCLSENFGTDGQSIPSNKQIASGQTVTVNGTSVSFNCGSKTTSTGGQIRVTGFQIEYTDDNSQMETYTNLTAVNGSSEVKYTGDNGYKWKVKNFAHRDSCAMYDYLGTRLFYNGYIATDGAIEGGIKNVSFEWRMAGGYNAGCPLTEPVKFTVTAGSTTETCTQTPTTKTAGHYMTYNHAFEEKSNSNFSINVGAKESTAQTQPVFGPVTITPYLLYTKKAVTIKAKDYASENFKYTNTALINNTAGEGTISYEVSGENANKIASIDPSTGQVTIKGEGTVTVTASWEGVTTTYSLTIQLETPSIGFAEQLVTKTLSAGAAGSYQQPLTFNTPSTGTGSYYKVSGPASGTVDSDGTVHYTEAGDYVIRGVFNTLPYKPDSDTYTLRVTDLEVPTLKFDTSYVEKPVGAAGFINPFSKPDDHTGAVTYSSSETGVATVEENGDGTVTIVGVGTTTITASVAETSKYAAGTKSYSLKVFPLSEISFAGDTNVYLNAPAFTRAAKKTAGDGAITYSSSAEDIATVNNGVVTLTGTKSGPVTITAIIAKTNNYWADTASYKIEVSSLSMPTASFAKDTVYKNQKDDTVTIAVSTNSDGVKTYESSDPRVATVDATTGKVTMGEKPGTTTISVKIDASATWEKVEASYTLNVSAAKVADLHLITKTVAQMRGTAEWAGGSQHPNIDIVDGIVLSDGKYYSNIDGEHFRYYYNADPKYVSSTTFTIQAKAGVIIQTVKINYIKGNDKMVLADDNYNGAEVPSANRIISGTTYKVDANSVTYYVGRTGTLPSANNFVNVTGYEITYFDPSTGVAVTKVANDLGKDLGLTDDKCYDKVMFNQAISINVDPKYTEQTLRYSSVYNQFNCYRWCGPITIKAREGATIHHVKITYTTINNAVLTKYFGSDGTNIPVEDRIASDSVIYVNADSVKLYVGSTASNGGTASIKKIYVNYTDNSEVVVDNFNNCESKGTGGSVDVAGVDGKYNWSIYNFSRSDANRMYYDQSIKLNKGGKIVTNYTGGLKEVAFDWHPTEKNKAVKFTVKAGGETYIVEKAAVDTIRPYTFNFQRTAIKSNGEFSVAVDNASGTQVEIGHVSLTPYIIYTDKEVEIAAKDYKDAGYKFTNSSLINYTGETVAYSITGDASIAEVNPTSGEVTIKGGGTVTVNATADGATASYKLTINLESTSAVFDEHVINRVGAGSYKQELTITTEATEGNVVTYSFVGEHEGATIDSSTGEVSYTQAGQFKIKGELAQNMPYAAAADTFTLKVTIKEVPGISYAIPAVSCKVEDDPFTNELSSKAGVGDTTYVSTDPVVATVDGKGEVTPLKPGVTIIKAIVAESENYAADTAWYTLTVLGKSVPGMKSVDGNIEAIADRDSWSNDQYYSYFKLDDVISVSDSNRLHLNSQYLESEECVRFYQNQTKGQFFVRAKAGVIIQAVKFTYTSQNDGVITNNYGSEGKSIGAANQYLSGVTYKTDANKLVFYTGSTTDKTNGEVHITGIAVKYFDPDKGVEVTKNVADLAKQNGLKSNVSSGYQNIAVNNVIKLQADKTGTLKYYSPNQLNCYNHCGPIDIIAREGSKINYVKVTYGNGDGVLTQNVDGGLNLSPAQYIASDSIMEVNAQSFRLYIGSKGASYQTLAITKIYVNYTDSKAIVDNFDNCTKIYGGDAATKVMGVDSTFEWEFTQFNRDSLRRIGYDQSTMLRQAGGKIAANNVDGGIKEVSFDWFASNSNQGVKFYVKAGDSIISTIDSAAASGWYPVTYTQTGIKTNGAFSIEMDPASGSQMEVGHISLTPYLFYKEKEATVKVGGTYKNESLVDYRDSNEAITYESSKDSVATVVNDGTVTAQHVGTATITAKWNGVTTSYTLTVEGDKTTIVLKRNDDTENADTLINNYGEAMPAFTLPEREGWRFNAYFPDAAASKASERITVSAWDKTYWVANCVQNGVKMIDANRKWVYEEPTHTLYAQWKPELTIVLDNQGATTAGTEQVKTAHCPNNASVNLSQNITVPVKDGFTFCGYFTADSVQLIDANGAFIAKVPNYIDSTKMWQKDEGVTLYAHWELKTITLSEAENNATKIAENDGEVFGQVNLVRTLAAGKYNTFCLPFDITKAALAEALQTEIVSLATLNENSAARLEDNKLFIVAKELEDDDVMQAGKPYLLQIAEQVTNPSFSNVTINKANEPIVSSDGSVKFYGITSPFSVPNQKQYLFMSNNLLNWNNTGTTTEMKGLRAYFIVPGMVDPSQVSARLVFKLPNTPTELMQNAQCTMQGVQKVLINEQIYIIRNGVRYNANGQLIK